ncbi:hypothetical protein P8452_22130 [Trifolium repens]|nr:hypothetical protein P8452_22130 [Trifolium repens]
MASSSTQRKQGLVSVKPEPITLSSDDEGMKVPKVVRRKVVRRKEPECEWMIPVTRAIQNLKKKQTLICFIDCKICCNLLQHVPSWVVQDCLPHRTKIYLHSADTNRRYSCTITDPDRSFQRYITGGWYQYLAEHRPKVSDSMLFSVQSPPNMIIICLIRGKRRSR